MIKSPYIRLLALSFAALFLELMMIRWVPAVVRLVAYYGNLLLISSFVGLGIGSLLSSRKLQLYRFLPFVFVGYVGFLILAREAMLPTSPLEFRFFTNKESQNYVILVLIFVLNALMFVPIGERIGELFNELPPLRAYGWDLGGSLAGTVVFGLFSFNYFSPLFGIAAVMALLTIILPGRWRIVAIPVVAFGLFLIHTNTEPTARWSPYYHIRIAELGSRKFADSPPRADFRTMKNPPLYAVGVNQDFYQFHGSFDLRRYTPDDPKYAYVQGMGSFYYIPYATGAKRDRVAVIGAGGGPDVEAALLAGAKHVDAVDIDPMLIQISREFNASGVYDDPRVHIHIDDARVFFERTNSQYDIVVFAFLDSQTLSSALANIRLDSYVYTVESVRAAFKLVKDGGLLTLAFAGRQPWLIQKITRILEEGTGRKPFVYTDGARVTYVVPKSNVEGVLPTIPGYRQITFEAVDLPAATDDWPYLYLAYETIPRDYAIVIITLVILCAASILLLNRGGFSVSDGHFFFMGIGFLLLQTKSVLDCSLYFGATWLVTTIVIAGVLLMVLAANAVAMRTAEFRTWYYVPLIASLILLYFVPREWVLGMPFSARLAWTLLVVPIPIFFAGVIFSTTFRLAAQPSTALAANLVGAAIGGFLEYLNMLVGSHALLLIVIAAYLGSYAFASRRFVALRA